MTQLLKLPKLRPATDWPGVFLKDEPVDKRVPRGKGDIYGYDGLWIAGKPFRNTYCMTYWYGWGDEVFDIREFRKKAGFKKQFYANDQKRCNLEFIVNQVARISCTMQDDEFETFMRPLLISLEKFIWL